MHRQCDVGHDRLRARRRHFEITSRFLDQLVADIVERALLWGRNYFLVREGSKRDWIPVHHPPSAVNQSFLIEIDESSLDRPRVLRVHRKTLARPVAGTAQSFQLLDDDAAVFFLPLPDPSNELVTTEIVPLDAFFLAQL